MKLGNYCILCTDQKHLQNNFIKVLLTLFTDGNNFYAQQTIKTAKQVNRTDLD